MLATWMAGPASATPPLLAKAKEAGYPATDCSYCHTFDMNHMRDKAREAGISNMNCQLCHGRQLPKQGDALFNSRGRYLRSEKERRKQSTVDVAWLAGYVQPSPAPARKP